MAGKDRKKTHDLAKQIEALEERPYSFDLFQALRLIECLYSDSPRLGTSSRPSDDPIRLAHEPSMAFESAGITAFKPDEKSGLYRLTERVLGLLGPNGPLPLHLTEYAQERLRKTSTRPSDPTFARFLDIFHHRMLSLFYRAWANNEPTVSFDRPDSDRFAGYVGALAGLGMPSLRNRDEIKDLTKLYYCGRFAAQTKCPEGLQAIVGEYFDLKVEVEEFVGEWLPLPERDVFRLGQNPESGILGQSIVLGPEIWSCQHKLRLVLGPLSYEEYLSFLPLGDRIKQLVVLVRNYTGDELGWDLLLILKQSEVPLFRLDGKNHLGWTTWLGQRPVKEDAADLVLDAFAYVNLQPQRIHK